MDLLPESYKCDKAKVNCNNCNNCSNNCYQLPISKPNFQNTAILPEGDGTSDLLWDFKLNIK